MFLQAVGTDAVADIGEKMLCHIDIDLFPVPLIVPHLLAVGADRKDLAQLPNLLQGGRLLEVDGIAGAQTQLMLASELERNDSPKLSRRY